MRNFLSIFTLSLFIPFFVFADSAPAAPSSASPKNKGRTIVIEESPGRREVAPEVFVESGTEKLSGAPNDRRKFAYKSWEQRCAEWKTELQRLNGKNLMVMSCGEPVRSEEMINSEKEYKYHSTATYKIKVLGK